MAQACFVVVVVVAAGDDGVAVAEFAAAEMRRNRDCYWKCYVREMA